MAKKTRAGSNSTSTIALAYIARGWQPVPIPFRKKGPLLPDWQNLEITPTNINQYFNGEPQNVGVQMGPRSNKLADSDLDCAEALVLADYFLPTTPAEFGRPSKPRSHRLYYATDPDPVAAIQFRDDAGGMIVELRLGAGDKGAQTVFPGSTHETGELIAWVNAGDPPTVPCAELKVACLRIAVGALLLRHWPLAGSRHEAGLVIGGFLARAGWDLDAVKDFMRAVATEARDPEVSNRVQAATDSVVNFERGESHIFGLPKLREMFGEAVADQVAKLCGYSDPDHEVAELNKTYAVMRVRGQVAVMEEGKTSDGRPDISLMLVDHFKTWLGNRFKTFTTADGETKQMPLAKYWLEHKLRRQYEGLIFRPGQEVPNFFNLWHGFAVEPVPGDCSKFLAHLQENVTRGDADLYAWVVGFFADIVQNPAAKKGTSLVLRGRVGTGKTKVGEVIGSLLGEHYFPASEPRYITGRFNSHLVACLLLHADEGFWAGDKSAEGKLKDLVTGNRHPIEYKFREPVLVDNHLRLFVTGNADWQVPAGFEERRFCVLDMGEAHMKDLPYFAAIDEEMANGGRAALMHYLQNFDLSQVNLRVIPKTSALLEQQTASFTSEQDWWFDVLQRGTLPELRQQNKCSATKLHASYIRRTEQVGVRRKQTETKLGIFLRKAVGPDLHRERDRNADLTYYRFPALEDCRVYWAKQMASQINWPEPHEWEDEAGPF